MNLRLIALLVFVPSLAGAAAQCPSVADRPNADRLAGLVVAVAGGSHSLRGTVCGEFQLYLDRQANNVPVIGCLNQEGRQVGFVELAPEEVDLAVRNFPFIVDAARSRLGPATSVQAEAPNCP